MLVIAHRGASGLAPENTMESFRVAYEADADMLELDIRLTKDRVPVVIHDPRLLRTHHDRAAVNSLTLKELRSRTCDSPVPTLEEVLEEFYGKIILNIEIKSRGAGIVAAKLLKRKFIKRPMEWDNVLFSSFKARELTAIRKLSKRANLAFLHNHNSYLFIAYHRSLKLTAVGFHRLYINKLSLEIAKKMGLFTYSYTVNRPHTALLLDRQGIDGVVTNYPDRVLKEINRLGEKSQ